MSAIPFERAPDGDRLQALGVRGWPTWTCAPLEWGMLATPERGEPGAFDQGNPAIYRQGWYRTGKRLKTVRKPAGFA